MSFSSQVSRAVSVQGKVRRGFSSTPACAVTPVPPFPQPRMFSLLWQCCSFSCQESDCRELVWPRFCCWLPLLLTQVPELWHRSRQGKRKGKGREKDFSCQLKLLMENPNDFCWVAQHRSEVLHLKAEWAVCDTVGPSEIKSAPCMRAVNVPSILLGMSEQYLKLLLLLGSSPGDVLNLKQLFCTKCHHRYLMALWSSSK